MVLGSTSMRMRSSLVTVTPMRASSSLVVLTSCKCGTLPIVTGPSASSAPARIGSVAFLAPEIRTSPSSAIPPVICSLSTLARLLGAARRPLPRRVGLDRERVNLCTHTLAKRPIDQLVARQRPQALELLRHQQRREVRIVIRAHVHARLRQRRLDQIRYLSRSHVGP